MQMTRTHGFRLVEETPWRWRIDPTGAMRVPGIVFASAECCSPRSPGIDRWNRWANVATLPGIVGASYAMPDVHWGYGFPIGGVAATDVAAGGVVSPGGVGFDISCGVRLLVSPFTRDDIAPRMVALMDELSRSTPKGTGPGAVWDLQRQASARGDSHRRRRPRGRRRVRYPGAISTAARTVGGSLVPIRPS